MKKFSVVMVGLLLAGAVQAQTQPTPAPAPATGPVTAPVPTTAPTTVPGVSTTVNNPNLAVSSIKLDRGTRVSKIVGASVFGSDGKDIGKVDDLVMTNGSDVTLAVISVGGFLGIGSKLVAFPYKALTPDGDRLTLPGATADTLNAMPSFEY